MNRNAYAEASAEAQREGGYNRLPTVAGFIPQPLHCFQSLYLSEGKG